MEEVSEGVGFVLGVEVQLDHQVMRVAYRAANAMAANAGFFACLGEAVEGSLPGAKIADSVLDAECEHPGLRVGVWDVVIVQNRSPGGNPTDLGSLTSPGGWGWFVCAFCAARD